MGNDKFETGEVCYCKYMTKGVERWYISKIVKQRPSKKNKEITQYYIHYQGWNKRFDFWANPEFLAKDNKDNRKIADDLASGIYDAEMNGRTIEEVLSEQSQKSPSKPEKRSKSTGPSTPTPSSPATKARAKVVAAQQEEKSKADSRAEAKKKALAEKRAKDKEDKERKAAEKQEKEERKRKKNEEVKEASKKRNMTPKKTAAVEKVKESDLSLTRRPPIVVRKVDRNEAMESFQRDDQVFDVIEAPHDAEDVLRGDNFDPAVTEELIAVIEADMKKMRSSLMKIPCRTSILDIFNNYVKWHLAYEIIEGKGVSRRIMQEFEQKDTRSFHINCRPLSYKQELGRTIQILWPILNLLLDPEFFSDNLLYSAEEEQFKQLMKTAKFDEPTPHMRDREIKKPTRKSVLEEQCTIPTESRWFLKENDQELQRRVEDFQQRQAVDEDLTWVFEDRHAEGEMFSFVTYEGFERPSPVHIYGGRHLLRFFGHWIYKVGFLDKFLTGTLQDWQLEAADAQIESLMRFMLFEYQHECIPEVDTSYDHNPKK